MKQSSLRYSSFLLLLFASGCSRRDAPPRTPDYRAATPTNRSTVRSSELNREPYYTQPGVRGGAPVILPRIPKQQNFEPNDPLAEAVFAALVADHQVPTKYIAPQARDGVVLLEGTVESAAQKARAEAIARAVPGVHELMSKLKVIPPS